LKGLPRNKTKDVFGNESAIERFSRAEAKLGWTRVEVERKRKELDGMSIDYGDLWRY